MSMRDQWKLKAILALGVGEETTIDGFVWKRVGEENLKVRKDGTELDAPGSETTEVKRVLADLDAAASSREPAPVAPPADPAPPPGSPPPAIDLTAGGPIAPPADPVGGPVTG